MADGDAAAAAGLDVVSGTQSRTQGARNHNKRGDEIAAEMAARAAGDATNAAATALKLDAAKIIVQATAPANIAGTGYSGRIWIKKA